MIAKWAMKIVVKLVVRDTFDKQKILRLKGSPLESAAAGGDWLKVTRVNAMSAASANQEARNKSLSNFRVRGGYKNTFIR
jgi:hypothetical protein